MVINNLLAVWHASVHTFLISYISCVLAFLCLATLHHSLSPLSWLLLLILLPEILVEERERERIAILFIAFKPNRSNSLENIGFFLPFLVQMGVHVAVYFLQYVTATAWYIATHVWCHQWYIMRNNNKSTIELLQLLCWV